MQGQMFRLKAPTVGIIISSDDSHRVVTIPQDAIVTVVNGPRDPEGTSRMVDVLWEDQTVMMFTQDLHTRGERVDGTSAPA